MRRPLSVLLVEDSPADAELVLLELDRCGFDTTSERVDSEVGLRDALAAGSWQLVLCDHGLPGFSSIEALRVVRHGSVEVPFVIMSGTIGEEAAVEALKAGVRDVVLKGNLARLGPVVDRELREAENRRRHDQGERERAELAAQLIQKVDELELAKRLLEGKAQQLEISLKYKSAFFSNMSHELRTPLNGLLILAALLQDNPSQNLTSKQVEYASVIHTAGSALLRLLNGILDLAKVESGTITPIICDVALVEIRNGLQREFGHVADHKGLSFSVGLADGLPSNIATDPTLLHQVLDNLLANAFKFTKHGAVNVRVGPAASGWSASHDTLSRAGAVIAFSISDTGIGMAAEIHQDVFGDFIQGDGTTARRYGGTGLGLSISRKLVSLLGGEITLVSTAGEGSTFTVYLPTTISPPATATPSVQHARFADPAARPHG
jgi:signal transduction histidine kinase